ncbi:hypothetical protein SLE2022_041620 [Rubroshorea leprosula]
MDQMIFSGDRDDLFKIWIRVGSIALVQSAFNAIIYVTFADCDLVHNKAAIIAYDVRGIISLLSGLV